LDGEPCEPLEGPFKNEEEAKLNAKARAEGYHIICDGEWGRGEDHNWGVISKSIDED
jgi:hypothetical protein